MRISKLIRLVVAVQLSITYSHSKGQSSLLVDHSLVEVKATADTVIQGYRQSYVWQQTDTSRAGYVVVRYRNATNTDDKVSVVFSKTMYGRNYAMEIAGKPVYCFKWVQGKFLDVFPFYQRLVPGAAAETIAHNWMNKATIDTETGRREVRLHDEQDHWELHVDEL